MKIYIGVLLLLLLWGGSFSMLYGQLSIENCQKKARENYPLIKQYGLIEQTRDYTLSNANRGYLPQLSVTAQATYQSEVTSIPVTLPGIHVESLNKDQYKAVAELNQVVWAGGRIRSQKQMAKDKAEVEMQQLETDLYALNDRINQLFFGILLLDAQLEQNNLLLRELQLNFDRISAYIENGVANQTDMYMLKTEQLSAAQHRTELMSARQAFVGMLGIMIGEPLKQALVSENETLAPRLEFPALPLSLPPLELQEIKRPELDGFAAQSRRFETERKMLNAGTMPHIDLFVQGGYGNLGLNMLKDEFSPWYIGGLRLSWNLGNFYTHKDDSRRIVTEQEQVFVNKEVFLFNTSLQIVQQNSEIDKIKKLMRDDDEMIRLRDRIKTADEVKVANGTLSVLELLREINAGYKARQTKALHEIQLLEAIYDLKNVTNQ